ncbi:hypothetical protein IJI94_00720 [Candidatus Saccharibacteria bacterium]|nr:hypothetical protein [Candidatus Saccharibacteria bacterium]
MNKIFSKKLKATVKVGAVITLILSSVIFSLCTHNTANADASQGNQTTARQKVYYLALKRCNNSIWGDLNGSKSFGELNNIVNNERSLYNPGSAALAHGFWLEYEVKNKLATSDNGSFVCDSEHGKIAQTEFLMSHDMNFTQKELMCGLDVDGSAGLYRAKAGSGRSCGQIYDHANDSSGNAYVIEKTNTNYLDSIVRLKTFGGNPPGGSISSFTNLEMYFVYHDAFFSACADLNEPTSGGVYTINLWDDASGGFKEYHFQQRHSNIKPTDGIWLYEGNAQTCEYMAKALDHGDSQKAFKEYMEGSGSTAPGSPSPTAPGSPTDSDSSSTDKTCLSEAGSLGWIACPTGDSMESFTETAYEKMVEDYLKVEPELLGNGDASTEGAWSLFRDLANIGFVVLLLAIVFSQLTGVGIDNYGIKKTLPKIIVTALLVNLSYIICQAIVDVSNIAGNSGRELLDTIASTIAGGSGVPGMGGMIAGIAGALGIGSAAVASITILSGGIWALLLPLLLGLLSAIISIFFAFFLLAARKALVILLVVVSPVAFLLYALPNTKKVFDKWFKVFKAMVLLYPICGFVMGGGTLASTIILNGTSVAASDITDSTKFFLVLSALAIKIIPIFFIPTLLKGAFAALGSVGAKLSGLGKNLGGKATTAIRKSEGYQNAKIRSAAVKEGGIRDKLSRTTFGKKTGLSNRIARGNLAAAQLRDKQGDLSKWNNEEYRKNRAAALEEKEFDEGVKNAEAALRNGTFEYTDENGNIQKVSSNSQALEKNGDLGDLGKAFRQSLVRGDSNKAMALYNTLKGTDAGRQAIITALDKGGLDMDNAATARVVNSIANDTSYKKSNRSFSDWAQGMRGKTAANGGVIKEHAISNIRADYDKNVAGSLRAEDVKDMDDLEFGALVNAAKNNGARSSAVLSSVRSNSQIFDGLKQRQREQINDVLGNISNTPDNGMTADVDLRPGNENSGNDNSGNNDNNDGGTYTAGYGDTTTYST